MPSVISDTFDVTTLLGSHLGLSTLLPVQFAVQHDFTLNNYLNIFPNEDFDTTPRLRYFGVGINGCYNADDGILVSAYNPERTNMNLYTPIPIRCRPVDEDLTEAERANYRLRRLETINNAQYYCYYLKVLDFDDTIAFKRINPLTGREEEFQLNNTYLNPKPVKPNSDSTVTTDTSQVVAYCQARVSLEASEILEYINARYGDPRYARISEIGFFTGVDKEVNSTTGQGVPIKYTESIYTMLYNHLTNVGIPLTNEGYSIDSTFEITSRGCIVSS